MRWNEMILSRVRSLIDWMGSAVAGAAQVAAGKLSRNELVEMELIFSMAHQICREQQQYTSIVIKLDSARKFSGQLHHQQQQHAISTARAQLQLIQMPFHHPPDVRVVSSLNCRWKEEKVETRGKGEPKRRGKAAAFLSLPFWLLAQAEKMSLSTRERGRRLGH